MKGKAGRILWQAVFLLFLLVGAFRNFCHIFSITVPVWNAVFVLAPVTLWFTFLASDPFPKWEEQVAKKQNVPIIKRPISFLLLCISILVIAIVALNDAVSLVKGADTLKSLVERQRDIYYGRSVPGIYRGDMEYCQTLLHLLWTSLALIMAYLLFRWKCLALGLAPCWCIFGLGLLVGKTPGVRALLIILLGTLMLVGVSEKRPDLQRGSLKQHAVYGEGRGFLGNIVLLGTLGIVFALSLFCMKQTEGKLLGEDREQELLQFQHRMEHDAANRVSQVLQKIQGYTGAGAGVLGNQAPQYDNEAMFTVTMMERPQKDLYFRGFIGIIYNNGHWKEDNSFLKEFDQETGLQVLNQGYEQMAHSVSEGEGAAADMTIAYTFRNRQKYALMPYNAQYEEAGMKGKKPNGDLNVLRRLGVRSYDLKCWIMAGKGDPISRTNAVLAGGTVRPAKNTDKQAEYIDYILQHDFQVPQELAARLEAFKSMFDIKDFGEEDRRQQRMITKVQRYLWNKAEYSLDLAEKPFGEEYVEYFLFKQKKGFCEHFATAGTLLLRQAGIPARYVSGYRIHPEDFQENPDGSYTAQVLDSQAHAWSEVYCLDGGWTEIEMTPGGNGGTDSSVSSYYEDQKETDITATRQPRVTKSPEPEETEEELPEETEQKLPEETEDMEQEQGGQGSATAAPGNSSQGGGDWGWTVRDSIFLLAGAFLVFLIALWRSQHIRRRRSLSRAVQYREKLLAQNRLLESYLQQSGWRLPKWKGNGMEKEQYVQFWSQKGDSDLYALEELYQILEEAAFAREDVSRERFQWASQQQKELGRIAWENAGKIRKIYLRIIKNWRNTLT